MEDLFLSQALLLSYLKYSNLTAVINSFILDNVSLTFHQKGRKRKCLFNALSAAITGLNVITTIKLTR